MAKHFSPALVISLIALFVALGTGAYAASKIGTQDIKKKAVTGSKIANDAIKSGKVADGKLKGKNLAEGTIGGSKLDSGAVGGSKLGEIVEVTETSPPAAAPPITATATCPDGSKVLSGGFDRSAPGVTYASSKRVDNGWKVDGVASAAGQTVTAHAYCLTD